MNILKVRKRKGERTKREREKGRKHGIHLKEGRKKWREGGKMKHSMWCILICPFISPHLAQASWIFCKMLAIPTSKQHHTCTTRPHITPGMTRSLSASDPCNCLNLVTEQQQGSWKSLRQGSGAWGWDTAESWSSWNPRSLGGAIPTLPWTSCSPSDLSSLLHGLSDLSHLVYGNDLFLKLSFSFCPQTYMHSYLLHSGSPTDTLVHVKIFIFHSQTR